MQPPASVSRSAWITKQHLLDALAHAGIALGAAMAGGLVLALVLVAVVGTQQDTAVLPTTDLSVDVTIFFTAVVTLAAMVFGGELTVGFGGSAGFFSAGGGGSLWLFPLTLTLASMITVLWWGIRRERRNPLAKVVHRVIYGVAVGLGASLVLLILALIFTMRIDSAGAHLTVTSAGYRVVLFGTILIGGAAFLGRAIGSFAAPGEVWTSTVRRAAASMPRMIREALVYAFFGAVVFGTLGVVMLVVLGWDGLGAAVVPLAVIGFLNIAPAAAVLGHLGGITAGSAVSGQGTAQTVTVIAIGEVVPWLLVLAALLVTVFIAVWIGTRRARTVGLDWRSSWQLPVAVFAGWTVFGLLFFGASAAGGGSAGVFGGSAAAGVGLALWSPLVLAVWAFAVELLAQTLPRLVYGLSPRAHAALAGRTAVTAWAAPTPAATDPAQPSVLAPSDPAATADPTTADPTTADPTATIHPSPAAAAPAVPPPTPLSPGAKKGLLAGLIAVGAVLVLSIAGAIAVSVINASRGPEAVARSYLNHIAAGDAEAANALVDPNVATDDRAFLTDEVLASATERISDIEVKATNSGGSNSTYVEVSYKLDGVTQTTQLLAEKGAPEFLVLDTWEVKSSLAAPVMLNAVGQGAASIGGTEIPFTDNGYGGLAAEIVMYPGIYTVSSGDSEFFELEDAALQVGTDAGLTSLEFVPTEALVGAVQEQVDAFVDSCAAQTVAYPENCPFQVFVYPSDTPVTWTVGEYPTVMIDEDGVSFEASGGTVTATYTETFFGSSSEESDERDVVVYGDIAIEGDEVKVEFNTSWW